ncbi:MAG: hypothetical protein KatS3mg010_1581 [Acidimicrobiia bacterium]|nr:MAG: hypothetical protein KatS3mg010_1581 [Acidimicrobiia bacterium]
MRGLARRDGGTGEDPPIEVPSEVSPAWSGADAEPDAAPPAAPVAAADAVEEAADPVSSLLAWYGSRAAPEPTAAGALDPRDGPPASWTGDPSTGRGTPTGPPNPQPEPPPNPNAEPEPAPRRPPRSAPSPRSRPTQGARACSARRTRSSRSPSTNRRRAAHARWADPHAGRASRSRSRRDGCDAPSRSSASRPSRTAASSRRWNRRRCARPSTRGPRASAGRPALLREASAVRSAPPEAVPGALLAQSTYLAGIAARASEATTLDDRYDWDLLVEEVQWPWA